MTTQHEGYSGYSSYNQDISDAQYYDIDHDNLSQDIQKPNRHNQTYEEAPNFPVYEPLNQVTNKIKISDALSNNLLYQCPKYSQSILKYTPRTSRTPNKNIPINVTSAIQTSRPTITSKPQHSETSINHSKPINQSKVLDKKYNIPLQTSTKNTRSRSLLYFQQNIPLPQTPQLPTPKQSSEEQIYLPLQQTKSPKLQQQSLTSTYYLPITQITPPQKPKYFVKNQQHSINTKREILLTSRSGYTLGISGVFLENITKQYENHNPNKENEVSLKQKIQLKLIKDKNKRVNTQFPSQYGQNAHRKSVSKLYRPLNPSQCENQRIILSTQSFENRQQKTLENKKNKVQLLKEKKLQAEIKQCTFKPKTNITKKSKLIN